MEMTQTHEAGPGVAGAAFPDMPGVYFLGDDVYVTDWSLAKNDGSVMRPKRTATRIRVSSRALTSGREAYMDHHRLTSFQGGRPS